MRLTDLQLRKLPIPERGQKTYWEEGFGVRVSQGGTKSFVVMRGKDRKLTTIGRYPSMSLKTARREAQLLKLTDTPDQAPKSLTEAREAYLRECERKNRPATVHVYRNYLYKLDKSDLTDVRLDDIDRNSPHAVTTWKVFFNWCVKHRLVEHNPFTHERVSYGKRERVLSDDELRAIWSYEDGRYSTILRLLILTGQRVGEITQLQPDWIVDDTINIPATVAKNKRSHTVPFNLFTAQYIKQHELFNGFSKAKRRLDQTVQLPHWTLHDLRRTFATNHAKIGTPIHVVEALLNHRSGTISGVAEVYIRHSFLKEMRVAAQRYECYMWKLLGH